LFLLILLITQILFLLTESSPDLLINKKFLSLIIKFNFYVKEQVDLCMTFGVNVILHIILYFNVKFFVLSITGIKNQGFLLKILS